MNEFKIELIVSTYSEDPTDWIIDAVADNLDKDEELVSITVMRYEQES